MSTLTTHIVSYINKAGVAALSSVMRLLVAMVTVDAADSTRQTLILLCCSLVPAKLIRSLLEHIAKDMVCYNSVDRVSSIVSCSH